MKGLTINLLLAVLIVVSTEEKRTGIETATNSSTYVTGFFALLKKAFYNSDQSSTTTTPPTSFSATTADYTKTEFKETEDRNVKNEGLINNSSIWPQDVFHAIYESVLFRKISPNVILDYFNEKVDVNSPENLPTSTLEGSGNFVDLSTTRRRSGRRRFGVKKQRTTVSTKGKSETRVKSTSSVTTVSFSGVTTGTDWFKRTKRQPENSVSQSSDKNLTSQISDNRGETKLNENQSQSTSMTKSKAITTTSKLTPTSILDKKRINHKNSTTATTKLAQTLGEHTISSTNSETPVKSSETTVKSSETPVKSSETPVKSSETPVINPETPVTSSTMPTRPTTAITSTRTMVSKSTPTVIHENINATTNSNLTSETNVITTKPNLDTNTTTSILPSATPPTIINNATVATTPATTTQFCVPGGITKFDIQLDGRKMVVSISPSLKNTSYNLQTNPKKNVDTTVHETKGTVFNIVPDVTPCTTIMVILTTNFCQNNEINAQFQTGILNETILSGIQVSNIRVKAKPNSTMEVNWTPPILQKKCAQYKLNYTIRWFPLGKHDTEGTISTNESRYSIAVKEYDQSYNVCVTVSVISDRGISYERVEKGKEVCDATEKSSPGKPSPPIFTSLVPTTDSIGVTFEDPQKPNGNIEYFEYTYCEGQNCTETNWVVNATKNLTLINLLPCTEYEVIIWAVNEDVDGTVIPGERNVTSATTKTVEPSVITDLRGGTINETSLNVTWDAISTKCAVNYSVTLTPNSKCDAEAINKTGKVTTVFFDNLKPYTRYNVNVTATNEAGSNYDDTLVLQTEYGALEKPKVKVNYSSTTCDFAWTIPPQSPGPISYFTELIKITDNQIVQHCVKNVTDDDIDCLENIHRECEFENLEPYTRYNWSLLATVGSKEEFQSDILTTKPDVPGIPRNFKANCNYNDKNGTIEWKLPEKTNGKLEKFVLNYTGNRAGKENHTGSTEIDIEPNGEILTKYEKNLMLNAEYHYTFTVTAKTKDVQEPGKENTTSCIKNALKPEQPKKPPTFSPTNTSTSVDSVTFTLNSGDFPDDNGKIINYSLIVFQQNPSSRSRKSTDETEKFWYHVKDSPIIPPYRTSPDKWNPFTNDGRDDMCCDAIENGKAVRCIIGCNDTCEKNTGPCNGPLRLGVDYVIYVTFCNAAGCADSQKEGFSTQPRVQTPDSSQSNSAALAVSLILITLAIIAGFFVYYRRDNIKKWWREHHPKRANPRAESIPSVEDIVIENHSATRPVKLADFFIHYTEMSRDSSLKFSQEYEELKAVSPAFPITAAQLTENRSKNRWINVLPFDHSRVKLLPNSDDITTDYINACYIPGFNSQREYIATQGPLPGTKDDFWRMVWEQSSQMIIMVTQCVERGKLKCETYWPEDREVHHYADIAIRLRSESVLSNFTIRIFDLNLGTKSLEVKQMHFTKWPDFGCPENTDLLIDFIQAVREHTAHGFVGPFTVHCSAGVGRTGTYIAVDRLMQHVRQHHTIVDIYGLVLEMRQHRVNMVQTEDQYVYIHSCLKDLLDSIKEEEESEPLYTNSPPIGARNRESQL